MKKIIIISLFFPLSLLAQWKAFPPTGGNFIWSKTGQSTIADSLRFIQGSGATLTQSGHTLAIATSGGSGITLPQARAGTGWTNQNGIITRDTVATRIEWGGVSTPVSVKIFDADGDTIGLNPNSNTPFILKDGTTVLLQSDSSGTLGQPTSGSTNFGYLSSTALGGTAFGESANSSSGLQGSTFGHQSVVSNSGIAFGYQANSSGSTGGAFGNGAGNTIANAATMKFTQIFLGDADNGETSTAPTGFRFDLTKANGVNVAGAGTFSLVGGLATGNAASGDIIFFTGQTGGSSSTLQTATEQLRIENNNGGVEVQNTLSLGTDTPVAGSFTVRRKPSYFTYEGIPAASDSSIEIDIEGTSAVIRGRAGDGSASDIAWQNGDSLNFSFASGGYRFKGGNIVLTDSLIVNNNLSAGTNSFSGTATSDTVTVAGAGTGDLYWIQITGAGAPLSTDVCRVEALSGSFVVHRLVAGTSGLTYNWKRERP